MSTRNKLFSQHLLNGANDDMAVDGSSTAVTYGYTVQDNERLLITRGLLAFEHGAAAFAPGVFGALGGALTNGVEISYTTKAGEKVVVDTWKTNRQVRDTMFDFDQTFKTNGVYTGRWTFTREMPRGLKDLEEEGIILEAGDKFEFKIQDDLSSLSYLSFKLKGKLTVYK